MSETKLFFLLETHEFFHHESLIRLEVFQLSSHENVFRVRVWIQNTYNLYPTFLNLGENGEDLQRTHSSDQLNSEISSLISESPEWLTGFQCESKETFIKAVFERTYQSLDELRVPKIG